MISQQYTFVTSTGGYLQCVKHAEMCGDSGDNQLFGGHIDMDGNMRGEYQARIKMC